MKKMKTSANKRLTTANCVSLDSYFLQLARIDAGIADVPRIFVVDFSQLSKEPSPTEIEQYFTKVSLLLHSTDIAIFLPFKRLQIQSTASSLDTGSSSSSSSAQNNESAENSEGSETVTTPGPNKRGTRRIQVTHFNKLVEESCARFPNAFQAIVYFEVRLDSSTAKGAATEQFKDVTTGVIVGGGSEEEASGYFKWLLSQPQFLSSPLVSDLPSLAWKDRLRRSDETNSKKNVSTPSGEKRGREIKPNQRHIDFWKKTLCHVAMVKQYSRVVSFEKYLKKENPVKLPVVIDLIGGCLDLFFASNELGLAYVAEIPKDESAEKAASILMRQVNKIVTIIIVI